MTDIFREIDEDMRRERMGKLWQKYGSFVVAAAVLLVIAVAGWRGWEYWRARQEQAAGAQFEKALELARDNKNAEAEKAFAAIAAEAPGGYRIIARLRGAAEEAKLDPEKGVAAWKAIAADAGVGSVVQDLARLRAGYIEIDKVSYADLSKDIDSLAGAGNPWRNEARELLGLSALKAGDRTEAGKWFDQIVSDRDAPAALRKRAEDYLGLVAGGPVRTQ